MTMSYNGNIFRVTGSMCGQYTGQRWIPLTRPVMLSFGVFFDLRLNKRLGKQPRRQWFETPSHSLWRHCNESIRRNFKGVQKVTERSRWSNPWNVQQAYTGLFFPWDSESSPFQNAVRLQCSYMNDAIFHAVELEILYNVLSLQGICNICKLPFWGYTMTKSFIIFYFVLRNGCLVNRDTKKRAKWRFCH